MTPSYGNPILQVRLTPETHEHLKQVVGESAGGKAGGVSLFVRRLIYRELQEPMPPQWGKDDGPLNILIESCAELEQSEDPRELLAAFKSFLAESRNEADVVNRNLSYQILGRLTERLFEQGLLKLND